MDRHDIDALWARQQELEEERRAREEELLADPEYVLWLADLLTKHHTKIHNPNQLEIFNHAENR